ncbi:hypothetical protein F66182_4526 [Fusarium sp. NRRL 66182]|nr:hypothetical protein F66182_4526 [Fusarium sp. NRRL 66182]
MSTTTASSNIVFYDILMAQPVEKNCCSPNPWKTRFALNFKSVPYSTTWVALPDISKVRSNLQVPACRKFADGSDFFTLPVIEDPTTGSLVGDSFDIAIYLDKTYRDSGAGDLLPPQKLDFDFKHSYILVPLSECDASEFPEYARFNMNVDAAFTAHTVLGTHGFPFDPATEEATKAEFVRRAEVMGFKSWDDFLVVGEKREQMLTSFRDALGELAKLFSKDPSGPFILGTKATYADMIVGAWLRTMHVTLPENEWNQVASWHDGTFGKLYEALQVYAEVK